MNSTHEDSVLSFDLDFLHPTTNNIPVQALRQRYIGQIKKRIIRVDALNNHCNSLKLDLYNKNKELELIKKKLESTNQEHTQTSLEYKEVLENYSKCEMECQNLKTAVNNYQEKYYEAENRVHAGKSHVVQLQQLVKQYERKIDTLLQNEKKKSDKTVKDGLEKELLQWKKKYKKDIAEWRTKYDTLLKKVQETKSSTAKFNKQSSARNEKTSSEIICDSILHDENSDNEEEISVDFTSTFETLESPQKIIEMTQSTITNKHNMRMEVDSDCKIESVSVDTGCGSSLASSDNEKWLNSPDYFFSPVNGESADKIRSRKLVDIATSPVLPVKITVTATSPIPSVVMVNVATSPITIQSQTCKESEPLLEVESKIVNVELTEPNNNIVATEVYCPVQDLEKSPPAINEKESESIVENILHKSLQETQTQECLQLNNSNNLGKDCNTDREIEMILNNMRLNHKLITPIPKTPRKVGRKSPTSHDRNAHMEYSSQCACPDAAIAKDMSEAAREEAAQAKKDIAKTNESHNVLISNLATLMKDMFYVKTFLKSQFSTPGTALENLNDFVPSTGLFENVPNISFNDDDHNLLQSANSLENSLKQKDFGKSSTSSKIAPGSFITMISEHMIKSANIENLSNAEHEKEILPNSVQETVSEQCVKQNEISNAIEPVMSLNTNIQEETDRVSLLPTKEPKRPRYKRLKKLTNLTKYRNKCEIRNRKIKRETPPLRKPRMKPKQVQCHGIKKVSKNDTSATLNDKQVYAKAVKVMAELNAKTPKDPVINVLNTSIQQKTIELVDHNSADKYETSLLSHKTPATLLSPTLKVTSPTTGIPQSEITTSITTVSQRRSTRLSKSSETSSDIAITSPDLTIASSTPTLRSPKPSIISPQSPKPLTKSPTTTIRHSPVLSSLTPSNTSPRRSSRLLDYGATSPKSLITASKVGIISKRRVITSPKPDSTLPNFASSPPTITLPKLGKAPSISSDIMKVCSHIETNLSNHKDVSTNRPDQSVERKRKLSTSSDTQSKRVLRSSVTKEQTTIIDDGVNKEVSSASILEDTQPCHPKESILCAMIEKYGISKVRPAVRHVPDAVLKNVNSKIEEFMMLLHEGSVNKHNNMMVELVEELKTYNYKNFVSGLTKYLTNPERKMELFGKISSPPAPQMTKSEAVLLYVIRHLRSHWRPVDIVATVLSSLEHTLFKLNRTPEFEVIESVSHFYALLCRYFNLQSRLKVFMLDAMYCILYKSAPLIKQCLEVWPHIIPLAHMSAAKIPLVTIFVYLLHFYKCEDKFYRVQEIRNILYRKYSYQLTEWNEGKILELVGNSISELKDIPLEKKMLRIAIIILAKRHGPRWTQNNIIKKLLQFIDKETLPEHVIGFCVSLIGPLMRPYPIDMKVYCEIAINLLFNILNTTASKKIEEAAISSMIIMSRHNIQRVHEILLSRKMESMSPELAELFRVYIRMKPLNVWLKNLSRPPISN